MPLRVERLGVRVAGRSGRQCAAVLRADDEVGAARNAGIPPESTGAERDAVLAGIHDVDGNLIRDEGGAVKRGP
ncbi:hypothetical protein [Streptomyces sparsus]